MFGLSTTGAVGLFVAGAAVVVAIVIWIASCASNDRTQREDDRRIQFVKHNTTIRVCFECTGSGAENAAHFMNYTMNSATCPGRVEFATVSRSTVIDLPKRYKEIRGSAGDGSVADTNVREASLLSDEDQGWMQSWNLWNNELNGGESIVMVVDPGRFRLVRGWDMAAEKLAKTLDANTVFTASGPTHFPCMREGPAEVCFFPRVDRAKYASRSGRASCTVADKGLLLFRSQTTRRGPASVFLKGRCSRSEADVAFSDKLFQSGIKIVSEPCPQLVDDQVARLQCVSDAESSQIRLPTSVSDGQYNAAVHLSPAFLAFAGLVDVEKDDPKHADTIPYEVTVRARMGLTPLFHHTREMLIKYGTKGDYNRARQQTRYFMNSGT
jgi:hypothetical protein